MEETTIHHRLNKFTSRAPPWLIFNSHDNVVTIYSDYKEHNLYAYVAGLLLAPCILVDFDYDTIQFLQLHKCSRVDMGVRLEKGILII